MVTAPEATLIKELEEQRPHFPVGLLSRREKDRAIERGLVALYRWYVARSQSTRNWNPDQSFKWHAFRTVVFPALRPINIVVAVVTVIEALRAFDIVYIINNGRNGLELLSVLITDNIIGEASRIGYGSAIAVVLLTISLVPITIFIWNFFQEKEA